MRQILNLNTKWAFSKEATAVPAQMPEKWYWVNLPHTWNNIDGQDGGGDYYRNVCYYAKTIDKIDLPEAERYFQKVNGANIPPRFPSPIPATFCRKRVQC